MTKDDKAFARDLVLHGTAVRRIYWSNGWIKLLEHMPIEQFQRDGNSLTKRIEETKEA